MRSGRHRDSSPTTRPLCPITLLPSPHHSLHPLTTAAAAAAAGGERRPREEEEEEKEEAEEEVEEEERCPRNRPRACPDEERSRKGR